MMVGLYNLLMGGLALLLLLFTGVVLAQVGCHLWLPSRPGRKKATPGGLPLSRPSLAVIVPAHDEAEGIEPTLASILLQLRPGDALWVVADNCSDDTAARARACGAQVAERFDTQRRGKGHALAFGLSQLRGAPPDLVVFIDADCTLEAHALERLAATVLATGRPAQARYLMLAPEASGLGQRFAEFTWRIRNSMRPSGGLRLGMPCQLMGTGMAFAWAMLAAVEVGTGSIVEDMALGVDLAGQGQPPVYCPEAEVSSRFPTAAQAQETQQTRWIHGHLAMLLEATPKLLVAAWRRRDAKLLGMALDLSVPPLTLLGMALMAAWLLGWVAGASLDALSPLAAPLRWHWPAQALGAGVLAFAAVLAAAWRAEGQDLISRGELLRLPLFLPAKLKVFSRFISRRQEQWIRTDRDKR